MLITVIFALKNTSTIDLPKELFNNSLTKIEDTEYVLYIPCIFNLLEKYFRSKIRLKGSLIIFSFTPNGSQFQKTILKSFNEDINHEYSIMAKYALLPHFNASHVTDKAKNYFFMIEKSDEIPAILNQLRRLPTWNPFAKVLVLLMRTTPFEENDLNTEIIEIFGKLLNSKMLNANVLYVSQKPNTIEVVTWFPYEDNNCAKKIETIRLIDRCEVIYGENSSTLKFTTFLNNIQRIPENLHNCPLMIATSDWPPFTIYNQTEQKFVRGVEIEMLKTVAEKLGMKPVFVKTDATRSQMGNSVLFYASLLSS